jgi:cobalt-zinc-cadmium efflux system membrane fusion protein
MNRTLRHRGQPILLALLLPLFLLPACGGSGEETPQVATIIPGEGAAPSQGGSGGAERCVAHGADLRVCFLCDPELRDPGRLWCREHDRYEDRCWECHPEARDADRLYCSQHGLYEDECVLCRPSLQPTGELEPVDDTGAALFCGEHGVPESECGICQPALADGLRPGEGLKIRLAATDAADRSGIAIAPLAETEAPVRVRFLGEVSFNRNRLIRITPPVGGFVRAVLVEPGDGVEKGDGLLEIASRELGAAKEAYLRALAEEELTGERRERETSLHEQGVAARQDLDEALAAHTKALSSRRAAAQYLLDLGFSPGDLDETARTGDTGSRLVLRAPFPGTITDRTAVVGDFVDPGAPLLDLCDLSTLWVELSVPEAAAGRLHQGLPLVVRSPGLAREFPGSLICVADDLDPHTRLARVRAQVPNPDRRLKAGMYVEAFVDLGVAGSVRVARDAVHHFGGNPFVFLELEPDLFEVRRVELGGGLDESLFVTSGLMPGDRLVTDHSYLVKAEFQKSRLGAGCVH